MIWRQQGPQERHEEATSKPLVSVVIPAFKAESSIGPAIDSALSQTMSSLEVIVVDDGSGDETHSIATEIAARDPRVRVFKNETNIGFSRTMNRGLREVRGEWVAPLDCDDTWRPERLGRMLAFADDSDVIADDVAIAPDALSKDRHGFQPGSMLRQVGLHVSEPRRLSLIEFLRSTPRAGPSGHPERVGGQARTETQANDSSAAILCTQRSASCSSSAASALC